MGSQFPRVRDQLGNAPPLQGYVAGALATLRVDPSAVSVAFNHHRRRRLSDLVFPGNRGFLRCEVIEEDQVVFLVQRTWL
jgi:hypothetical protein